MKPKLLDPSVSLTLLREDTLRLERAVDGQPPGHLHAAPAAGEWSPNEILAHLRACSDVWGGNIARILAEEHPVFAGVNPRSWLKRTGYLQWQFETALHAFLAQRRELLTCLDALTPGDWTRTATVTAWGQSNERSLGSYVQQLATHERSHIRQVERTLQLNASRP